MWFKNKHKRELSSWLWRMWLQTREPCTRPAMGTLRKLSLCKFVREWTNLHLTSLTLVLEWVRCGTKFWTGLCASIHFSNQFIFNSVSLGAKSNVRRGSSLKRKGSSLERGFFRSPWSPWLGKCNLISPNFFLPPLFVNTIINYIYCVKRW